jgi:hypothetical protein
MNPRNRFMILVSGWVALLAHKFKNQQQLLEILLRRWCLSATLNAGSIAETHLLPLPGLFTVLIDLQGEIIGHLTRKKAELGKKDLKIFKLGGPMGTITSKSRTF